MRTPCMSQRACGLAQWCIQAANAGFRWRCSDIFFVRSAFRNQTCQSSRRRKSRKRKSQRYRIIPCSPAGRCATSSPGLATIADTLLQADSVGVGSLPIVILTGFFTGAVLALQTSSTLQQFGSLSLTGKLVSLSMVRELGPVLTGLMVAGRNSSGMASELGSMQVTSRSTPCAQWGWTPPRSW